MVKCITYLLLLLSRIRILTGVSVTLISDPSPLTGQLCHSEVHLTCTASDLPTIRWFVNDEQIVVHSRNSGASYPQILSTSAYTSFTITVVSADIGTSPDSVNFLSTLDTDLSTLSDLRVRSITCGSLSQNARVVTTFTIKGSPPPLTNSSLPCMITNAGNRVSVTLPRSQTNIDSGIDEYRIRVEPEPDTACSMESVGVGMDYVCSGFETGIGYSYTVSAVNCNGAQEGPEASFTIRPQVPRSPSPHEISAVYNSSTLGLNFITLSWVPVTNPSVSADRWCSFNESIHYVLEANTTTAGNPPEMVYSELLRSDVCVDDICFVTVNRSLSQKNSAYQFTVRAINTFGSSKSLAFPTAVASTNESILSHTLTFENCITFALCSTDLDVTECEVTYGLDPAYPDTNPSVVGPTNEVFELPILQRSTLYYHQARIVLNTSSFVVLRGEFMTGDFAERLTGANRTTIIVCVLFLALALSALIFSIVAMFQAKNIKVRVSVTVMLGFALLGTLGTMLVWITSAVRISSQTNTCEVEWQATRDSLILSAGVLSVLMCLFNTPVLILSWILVKCIKNPVKKSDINRQRAAQYYDYIDTAKAHETGIRLEDNYAYNNPSVTGKANAGQSSQTTYADPSRHSENPTDIPLKANKAYLESKKKKKTSLAKLSRAEREAYANTTPSLKNDPSGSKSTDSLKKTQERATYAPPLAMATASVTNSSKDAQVSSKGPQGTYEPLSIDKDSSGRKKSSKSKSSKLQKPKKERQTYASPLDNIAPLKAAYNDDTAMKSTSVDAEYVGPVVPPPKHTEGIDLKQNYAYKVTKQSSKQGDKESKKLKQGDKESKKSRQGDKESKKSKQGDKESKKSRQGDKESHTKQGDAELYTTTDGYVGPIEPPKHHTEGINLKDNYAYSVTASAKQTQEQGDVEH